MGWSVLGLGLVDPGPTSPLPWKVSSCPGVSHPLPPPRLPCRAVVRGEETEVSHFGPPLRRRKAGINKVLKEAGNVCQGDWGVGKAATP